MVKRFTLTWVTSDEIQSALPGIALLPALVLDYAGQIGNFLEAPNLEANPFFKLAPQLVDLPAGCARNACHHHRQPSHHDRFILHDEAGHAARLASRCADQSDFGRRIRTDLRIIRELEHDGVYDCLGRRVRKLRSACRSLRDRGLDHDGPNYGAALPCDAQWVAVVALSSSRRHGYLVGSRSGLLLAGA